MKIANSRILSMVLIAILLTATSCSVKEETKPLDFTIDNKSVNQLDTNNIDLLGQNTNEYVVESLNYCKNQIVATVTLIENEELQYHLYVIDQSGKIVNSVILTDLIPEETIISVFVTLEGTLYILTLPLISSSEYSLYTASVDKLNNLELSRDKIKLTDNFLPVKLIANDDSAYIYANSMDNWESSVFYFEINEDHNIQKIDNSNFSINEIVNINNQIAVVEDKDVAEKGFLNIYFLEMGKFTSPIQIKIDKLIAPNFYIGTKDGLFFSDPYEISFLDFTKDDTLQIEKILSFSDVGIVNNVNETNIMFCPFTKNKILYSSIINLSIGMQTELKNQFKILTVSEESTFLKTITITGKDIQYDSELLFAINNYNERNNTVKIVVFEHDNANNLSFEEQLSMSVLSGNVPDILYNYGESLDRYLVNDDFANLYDFMKNDSDFNQDDYLANILTLCETDGNLFQIFPSFSFSGFVGKESMFDSEKPLTISEFENLYKNAEGKQKLFENQDQSSILAMSVFTQLNQFVDYDEKTAYFDSPLFYDLLSFSKYFGKSDSEMQNYFLDEAELAANGELLLMNVRQLGDPLAFQEYAHIFSEPIQIVGFPSLDSSTPICIPNITLSIFAEAKEKELAWGFIKNLFSQEMQNEFAQRNQIPLLISALDFQIQNAMETDAYNNEYIPLSVENAKKYQKTITSIKSVGIVDEQILSIITEEILPYYADQKTEEEVITIIQSRVMTLLNEKR